MQPIRQQLIRKVLRQYPEGLTANQLEDLTNVKASDVRRCLTAMPDVYVDRWVKGMRGQFAKVWIAVKVPENCPHPNDRAFQYVPPKTKWVGAFRGTSSHEVHRNKKAARVHVSEV